MTVDARGGCGDDRSEPSRSSARIARGARAGARRSPRVAAEDRRLERPDRADATASEPPPRRRPGRGRCSPSRLAAESGDADGDPRGRAWPRLAAHRRPANRTPRSTPATWRSRRTRPTPPSTSRLRSSTSIAAGGPRRRQARAARPARRPGRGSGGADATAATSRRALPDEPRLDGDLRLTGTSRGRAGSGGAMLHSTDDAGAPRIDPRTGPPEHGGRHRDHRPPDLLAVQPDPRDPRGPPRHRRQRPVRRLRCSRSRSASQLLTQHPPGRRRRRPVRARRHLPARAPPRARADRPGRLVRLAAVAGRLARRRARRRRGRSRRGGAVGATATARSSSSSARPASRRSPRPAS